MTTQVTSPRRIDMMPLDEFDPEHRARIAAQVAQPHPPERYFPVGGDRPRPTAWLESRAWWEWHWQRGIDPDKKRTPLSAATRERIIARDGLVCGLCGGEVERNDVHIDHILPVARGGNDHPNNLQVSHSRCNMRKGARV